ncbi:MAG: stage III sporulation protein AG [Bacillota bacterium]|nr:stage III sporulation protein AG [Bacillota bacterium]
MLKFKEFFEKLFQSNNKKKIIENSVIVIIIGIIAIIAGGSLFKNNEPNKEPDKNQINSKQTTSSASIETAAKTTTEEKDVNEMKLEELLEKIKGAGKVDVMITYVSGKEIVPAYDTKNNDNETQEKDSGGGTRSVMQNDNENKVTFEEQGGSKKAIVLKELLPQVKGVVVVADGSSDPIVKERIFRAVQVLLDVPLHKVEVLERSSK